MSLKDNFDNLRKWAKRDQVRPTDKQPELKSQEATREQAQADEQKAQAQAQSVSMRNMNSDPAPSGRQSTFTGSPATRSGTVPTIKTAAQRSVTTSSLTNSITLAELALQNLQDMDYDDDGIQPEPPPEPKLVPNAAHEPLLSGMEGQVINDLYRIDKVLAQGGMGQVFLAAHLKRNEIPVVLKLLIKQADRNSTEYNRFLQEMLISGRMRHPNLIKVFDYGILLDGLKPYLVMEFVEGEPLRGVLRRCGTLTVPDAARIIMQACDGLHQVHEKGIVHRDLKPENLMVKGDYQALDNVKILDFGIAQLQNRTQFDEEGLAVGSVGYMSPEQICAQAVDHRTDIYSLGLILYETITGHPPFVGGTRRETMAMHVQAKHMPPSAMASIPRGPEVDRIVEKALAKHPDHRYQSVRELQQELAALLSSL